MAETLSRAASATLLNATVVQCREHMSAVRGGVQNDAVVGFARQGGHCAPRIAPPSPPCAASVSEEGNRGGEEAVQEGSAPSPQPGWAVPLPHASTMATAFCGLQAPRRHGHWPPRPPRLAPPCPDSPPRAATASSCHHSHRALRACRVPPPTRPSPLQPPRLCFPAASAPLLAHRSIPRRYSPQALAS
jgi:hypothetical protein